MYRVIAPDLRGHGDSAAPEGVYTMDVMAADVIELLDALQITEPVVLGGLSMGGYVALALWARYPERFRALMLMDTRAAADTPEAARNREELAADCREHPEHEARGRRHDPEAVLRGDADAPRRTDPAGAGGDGAQLRAGRRRGLAGAGAAARPDGRAATITVPTLVLVGAHDAITPPEESRKLAAAVPGAQLVIIPDAGHLAPLENPDPANEAILGFLSKLS